VVVRKSSISGVPKGTTANRPTNPSVGDVFYNGTLAATEIYTSSGWVVMGAIPSFATIGTAVDVGTNVTYGSGSVDVAFTPSASGGLATTFIATASPGGVIGTGSSSPVRVSGLTQGTAYTFTVVASNAYGNSAASSSSNSVTPTSLPQAPSSVSASPFDSSARITFTPGATGGSAVTAYTVTSSPGNITASGASSPITVTGLTNNTSYTFTVTATNANGTSLASSPSSAVTPIPATTTVEYLVVAGGGGGGLALGGGGGAGGFRTASGLSVTPGTTYTVTVGAGGVRGRNADGGPAPTSGNNSVFSTITSIGGGAGGGRTDWGQIHTAQSGGSGGGGKDGGNAGGLGTAGQGYAGAAGTSGTYAVAGGGGGAGGAGQLGTGSAYANMTGGAGGVGLQSSITGTATYYAGGGGGAGGSNQGGGGGAGGNGGGGAGTRSYYAGQPTDGTANTGGGGGGGNGATDTAPYSANGGSGVVILRYLNTYADAVSTTGSPTITNTGGYKIYKFNSTGSITF
jgi:hypothetical protein